MEQLKPEEGSHRKEEFTEVLTEIMSFSPWQMVSSKLILTVPQETQRLLSEIVVSFIMVEIFFSMPPESITPFALNLVVGALVTIISTNELLHSVFPFLSVFIR